MRLIHRLREMLAPMAAVPELGRAEHVAALVPPDAEYVTGGLFTILPDARAFVGGVPGRQPYRYKIGGPPGPESTPMEAGLLVLRGQRLSVLDRNGERWSVEASEITDLDGHRHSGFVVLTRNGPGLALSWQSPVEVPPGARWRTVPGMTNALSGWDKVLRPFGAAVHW